jgi:hypothetical protein
MIEDIISTLNWLAFTVPIGLAYVVIEKLKDRKSSKGISIGGGIFAAAVAFLLLFFLYQAVGFPFWMRWPSQLLGFPYSQ